jgi:ABC-type sugar transport system ATPase subunit
MLKVDEVLSVHEISKSFGATKALNKVNLNLFTGEVLAIAGENGAGKSTLMKVIAGLYKPDYGEIFVSGEKVSFNSPREAFSAGISIIYQELNLFKNLSIAENIFIDRLPKKTGMIDWKKLKVETENLLNDFKITLSPMIKVGDLAVGLQQLIEILKAVCFKQKIVIMDEPTSALTSLEIEKLFLVIEELSKRGTTIIFISHHIEEIFKIGQRIIVIRDGEKIVDTVKKEITPRYLVEKMIGKNISNFYPKKSFTIGKNILSVNGLSKSKIFQNVNFNLREREIIGIVGLLGCGKEMLAESLAGLHSDVSGTLTLNGKIIKKYSPLSLLKLGVAFVSENRTASLFFNFSVLRNISISILNKLKRGLIIDLKKEKELAEEKARSIDIKYSSIYQEVGELSGGNRQKVIVARMLVTLPKVLILDDPTKGIDIKTKTEIYNLLTNFLKDNGCVALFSSDVEEVLNMCDRIMIMYRGRIVAEMSPKASKEEIMFMTLGGGKNNDPNRQES